MSSTPPRGGGGFQGAFTSHAEVDRPWAAFVKTVDQISALQNWGLPGQSFQFAGIRWDNYAGSSDNKVAVRTDKVIFIPVSVPGLFRLAYARERVLPLYQHAQQGLHSLLVRDGRNAGSSRKSTATRCTTAPLQKPSSAAG